MQLQGPGTPSPARNSQCWAALLWSPCSGEGPAGAGRAEGHSILDRTQAVPRGKWSSSPQLSSDSGVWECCPGTPAYRGMELHLERNEHVLTQLEKSCLSGSPINLLTLPSPAEFCRALELTLALALAEALHLLPLHEAGLSQFNPLIYSVNITPLERPLLATPSKWPPQITLNHICHFLAHYQFAYLRCHFFPLECKFHDHGDHACQHPCFLCSAKVSTMNISN